MASDEQERLQSALINEYQHGRISRRRFIQGMLSAGMGMAGVSVLAACGGATGGPPTPAPTSAGAAAAPTTAAAAPAAAAERPLTPSFYQWIEDLHPAIKGTVNPKFPDINYQIAPVEGYDVTRFMAEAKQGESTWDVYVGMTPFVEMSQFIQAGVIEPWDNYIPKEVIDDIIPSIREECTVDGKLYSWPFLLDIIVSAQNNSIVSKAGLPDKIPADWDEYLASAKTVVDSGAAPYGCTFDANGWRSLAPITHSFST
nr:extracellular solute-binding protein [Anaerolineae bacterium]